MARNPRRVLSREFLLSRVRDEEFSVTENAVEVYVDRAGQRARCESHTRAVSLPGGCEHPTQTAWWRVEGGRGEGIGMRQLHAALFVTLDGYGEGEAAS